MDKVSDVEQAMRATQELKGFEINISRYTEDDLHKIIHLIGVYQSATERILRNRPH